MIHEAPHLQRTLWQDLFQPVVIVGALGYFVDIYDLTLCMAVKNASLDTFHIKGDIIWYADPMNWQMLGMLLGGLFFGILADRMGRLTTLIWFYFTLLSGQYRQWFCNIY
jgi:MFS family permease